MARKRQIYYHVTTKKLGKSPTIYPIFLDDDYQQKRKCICVAPSIVQCLIAIPEQHLDCKKLYIYSCDSSASNKYTRMIYDYLVTSERRYYHPKKFKLVRVLNGEDLHEVSKAVKGYHAIYHCLPDMKALKLYTRMFLKALRHVLNYDSHYDKELTKICYEGLKKGKK